MDGVRSSDRKSVWKCNRRISRRDTCLTLCTQEISFSLLGKDTLPHPFAAVCSCKGSGKRERE